MVRDDSFPIDYAEIIDLDETYLNRKRKKENVVDGEETIFSLNIIMKFLKVVEK